MTENKLRHFRCDASVNYAKYAIAHLDINFALLCLDKLRTMMGIDSRDDIIYEALWNAAIIRVFSVFDGKYALSKSILKELPEDASDVFEFFKKYRDKHIVHKANPFDQIKTGIILSNPGELPEEVQGSGYMAMKECSFADENFLESFGTFVNSLRIRVENYVSKWGKETIEEAKKIPFYELYKLPPLRVVVPTSSYLYKKET